jgi:anthranilate synthase component 1
MAVYPERSTFLELAADFGVIPVTRQVLADRETAVTAYEKLVGDDPGFLLESVEGGERWARWSFVGWNPEYTLTAREGVSAIDDPGVQLPAGNPLEVLESLISNLTAAQYPGLPPLHTGAVGWMGYDAVRYIEHLPDRPEDDRALPEMMWQFVGSLAAFDRLAQRITLVRNVYVGDDPEAQYDRAVADLDDAAATLGRPTGYESRNAEWEADLPPAESTLDKAPFEAAVRKAREYIFAGDAFQIVISQRLEVPFAGDPFAVYRALRMINPSPYLFYHRHADVAIIGSSPELMTRVRDGVVRSRPIAGTRPRGATPAEDERLAEELLADPKERAEHVMLIDLARNDVGRVCEFGTVQVDDLMVIERYSHVMHIVSGVSGKLRSGIGPVDVLRATFPHGTVSGAPKVRAMEIIDELEPVARGPYAGAVGYIDFSGNIDTAICLRTVVAAGGKAWVQAGAGLVADSDPAAEYEETMNKAAAALAAIAGAAHV